MPLKGDSKAVPTAFETHAGAKVWECAAGDGRLGEERVVRVVQLSSSQISVRFYHARCAP